jgi:hypothetical protein
MIIYIDENMPSSLARGFNILQTPESKKFTIPLEVRSIKDDFGSGVQDEEWIPAAGENDSCIITQDINIHRIKHQRVLCEQYNLGMFYFKPPSKNGFKYWDMLSLLVKHWPDIITIAFKEKKPFAFQVSSRSKIERL